MARRAGDDAKAEAGLTKSIVFFDKTSASTIDKVHLDGGFQLEHPAQFDLYRLKNYEQKLGLPEGTLMTPCFGPMRFSWLFATSTRIEANIKQLQRKAKEVDFDMIQLSQVADELTLNPFEAPTVIWSNKCHRTDLVDKAAVLNE